MAMVSKGIVIPSYQSIIQCEHLRDLLVNCETRTCYNV